MSNEQRPTLLDTPTRLELFIRANKIHRGRLAHVSRYRIGFVRDVRLGLVLPNQSEKEGIAQACSEIVGRAVAVAEVFDEQEGQKMSGVPLLKIVRHVSRRHGEVFAEAWLPTASSGEKLWLAFGDTGLIEWPEDAPDSLSGADPRQERYQDIEDEILELTFAAVKDAVAEAFTEAARAILARERRRQS